ncbi:hypothetical protein THAOC_10014 [Thalassiosira oceanica]|uniref:GAT domain-containing protein n=1 Tax=Thalassiosira oceanica TaxID=159749 RepID=K0TE10_THAOC|nr:hypothetical protein THAOC_10014 [Thalassiosira oceanica]|mmetsp:Transcript_882/g.1809  ORF Transcript_882/g.1809 Transcript_882/m.1809 type:complete len:221 (-) Transcript_882:155-817(-)|eukprot:EJK68777.1 hypothetical protein THAOC_10014 [Thalassiosira oceanica]
MTTATASQSNAASVDPDVKVQSDLSALSEQISLVRSMLKLAGPLSSIKEDEALLAVIGFLEACAPRMVELIEAAAGGSLGEKTFEECLVVNDRLTAVLADVEKDPGERSVDREEGDGAADDAEAGMKNLSVDGGATAGRKPEPAAAVGKTAGLDDPFGGGELLAPTAAAGDPFAVSDSIGSGGGASESGVGGTGAAVAGKPPPPDDDDFDSFFKERTSAP